MRNLGVLVGRLLILFNNESSFLSSDEVDTLAKIICNNHAGYFPNKAHGEVYMAINISNTAGLVNDCQLNPSGRSKHVDVQLGDKLIPEFPVIDIIDAGHIH